MAPIATKEALASSLLQDLPSLQSVEEVVVNEDSVDKDTEPLLIYSESSEEPASAS